MATKFVGFSTVDKLQPSYTLTDIALVKQNIMNAFMTRRSERIMEPELGSIIWELIMEPLDEITKSAIYDDVIRIINQEPRARLVDTNLIEQPNGVILEITINYMNITTEQLVVRFNNDI